MTTVRLVNGPCDPRDVEMLVSADAEALFVRPMPFDVQDVYVITDRFVDQDTLTHATADYLQTTGSRRQVDSYRRALLRLGAGRAFRIRREKVGHVH